MKIKKCQSWNIVNNRPVFSAIGRASKKWNFFVFSLMRYFIYLFLFQMAYKQDTNEVGLLQLE